ncbi:MAG: hypothetical protein ACR2KP_00290, partial [Egibacteraceae bacterium]
MPTNNSRMAAVATPARTIGATTSRAWDKTEVCSTSAAAVTVPDSSVARATMTIVPSITPSRSPWGVCRRTRSRVASP